MKNNKQIQAYLQIASPLVLGNLIRVLIPAADTFMVGHLGKQYLAAAALANNFSLALVIFLFGMSHGAVPLVAASIANFRYKEATQLFKHSMLINTALSAIWCILMLKIAPVLYQLKQDPEVARLAMPYFRIITIAILPKMVSATLIRYLEGIARTRPVFYATLFTCTLNITLNYLFIYGKLGIPAMGLLGAGWATLATEVLEMLGVGLYVFRAPTMKRYVMYFTQGAFSWAYFSKLLKVGIPIALHFAIEVAATAITVPMMGWISVEAQAAYALVRSIIHFGTIITWALATAASILVGRQFGKRNVAALRKAGFTGFMVAGLIALIISFMVVVARTPILLLYGLEYRVLHLASLFMVFAAVWNIFDSIYTIGMGVLRGIEDTFTPFIVTTITSWLIALPISYVLAFYVSWGGKGIWVGNIVGFALAAIALLLRFHLKSQQLAWGK